MMKIIALNSQRTLKILLILCFSLFFTISCSVKNVNEEDEILEVYAQIQRAFARQDLRGVMKSISTDFHSDEENQKNFNEVYEFRKLFLLNNNNVSVDFREITIDIQESKAAVKMKILVMTDQLKSDRTEIDSLQKRRGKWEIVSWKIIEGN